MEFFPAHRRICLNPQTLIESRVEPVKRTHFKKPYSSSECPYNKVIFADRVELDDSRRAAASTVLRGPGELGLVFLREDSQNIQDTATKSILNMEALVLRSRQLRVVDY